MDSTAQQQGRCPINRNCTNSLHLSPLQASHEYWLVVGTAAAAAEAATPPSCQASWSSSTLCTHMMPTAASRCQRETPLRITHRQTQYSATADVSTATDALCARMGQQACRQQQPDTNNPPEVRRLEWVCVVVGRVSGCRPQEGRRMRVAARLGFGLGGVQHATLMGL